MKKWLDELNELKSELETERKNDTPTEKSEKGLNIPSEKFPTQIKRDTADSNGAENNLSEKSPSFDGKKKDRVFDKPNTENGDYSVHGGHRKRMRDKILKENFENFPPHEILETLLFYCVPRKNTNPLAHKLIGRFGSINAILDADYMELKRCGLLTENSAFYLYFIGRLIKHYNINFDSDKIIFRNLNDYIEYLKKFFLHIDKETVIILFLDNSNKLLETKKIEGSRSEVTVTPKKIVEYAIHSDCKKVIIAHNHPGNNCKPSVADRNLTFAVFNALNSIEVEFIDHIIFGKDDYYSFRLEKDIEFMKRS